MATLCTHRRVKLLPPKPKSFQPLPTPSSKLNRITGIVGTGEGSGEGAGEGSGLIVGSGEGHGVAVGSELVVGSSVGFGVGAHVNFSGRTSQHVSPMSLPLVT